MGRELVCGLDIGGTKVLAVVFDPADPVGERLERRVATPVRGVDVLAALTDVSRDLSSEAESSGLGAVRAIGVGIAGLVDRTGVLRVAPNLPGIVDLPVRTHLAGAFGLPVSVDNDATAATWAEHRAGAGAGIDDLVVVTLGTGIGMGLVSGGHLITGRNGYAGEAGHMVVDPTGPRCPCGQRGCWERYASGSGLGRLAREAAESGRLARVLDETGATPDEVRGEHVTVAARAGDRDALAVLDEFASWVALGLVNLANILDPGRIVIAGGLVAAGAVLLDPVRRHVGDLLYASKRRPPADIVAAMLGEQAGAIGAGLRAGSQ